MRLLIKWWKNRRFRLINPGRWRDKASDNKTDAQETVNNASVLIQTAIANELEADKTEKQNELKRLEVELQYLQDEYNRQTTEVELSTKTYTDTKELLNQAARALDFDKTYLNDLGQRIDMADKQLETFRNFLKKFE